MKFSHIKLEQIRHNPDNVKEILTNSGSGSFSMNSAWKNSVKKYHQSDGNREEAFKHFDAMFNRNFILNETNNRKKGVLMEKLEQYIKSYQLLKLEHYNYSHRVSIDIHHNNFITGEIFRLDKSDKGYVVTLFQKEDKIWMGELRFPLIQIYYSNIFNCPVDDIKVGIYNFEKDAHEYLTFDEYALKSAQDEIYNLSNKINKILL